MPLIDAALVRNFAIGFASGAIGLAAAHGGLIAQAVAATLS